MKKLFLFLFLIILTQFTLAQGPPILKVLFQSIEETATVNLKDYLEGDNFFVNHSENLDVKIKDGIATISVKEDWKGAELLIFSTNETTGAQPIIFFKPTKEPQKVDLSEILIDVNINKSFLSFKDIYENLTELNLTLYAKSSEILINDNTLITIDFDNPIPLFSIEVKTEQESKPVEPSSNVVPYLIGAVFFVVILSILFTFKDMLLTLLKPKREHLNKAKAKENAIRKLENMSLRGNISKKIIRTLNSFFKEHYGIKSPESYLKTTSSLRKKEIPFSLKEDLINYYERAYDFHTKKLKLKDKDLKDFIDNLKEMIKGT